MHRGLESTPSHCLFCLVLTSSLLSHSHIASLPVILAIAMASPNHLVLILTNPATTHFIPGTDHVDFGEINLTNNPQRTPQDFTWFLPNRMTNALNLANKGDQGIGHSVGQEPGEALKGPLGVVSQVNPPKVCTVSARYKVDSSRIGEDRNQRVQESHCDRQDNR